VRIYDLVQQVMVKKLLSNSQWISTMDIHPGKLVAGSQKPGTDILLL